MLHRKTTISLVAICCLLLAASTIRLNEAAGAGPNTLSSIAQCRAQKAAKPQPLINDPNGYIACPPGTKDCSFPKPGAAWYVTVESFESLTVADDEGHHDTFPFSGPGDLMLQTVRSVSYTFNCPKDNCMTIILPKQKTYELTIALRWEIMLEVVKGVGNECPDEAIRYLGHLLPEGTRAKLTITPQGVRDLRYDENGKGNFAGVLKPVSHEFAPRSWDTEGPYVRIRTQELDSQTVLVNLTAEDESGIKTLIYCVDDGSCGPYVKPIKLTRGKAHHIRAFADDVLGNRGSLSEYDTRP